MSPTQQLPRKSPRCNQTVGQSVSVLCEILVCCKERRTVTGSNGGRPKSVSQLDDATPGGGGLL